MSQYKKDKIKQISVDLSQEDEINVDTVDLDVKNSKKSMKGKKSPEVQEPENAGGKLGFDLMSLTSRRGHYVDHVSFNPDTYT